MCRGIFKCHRKDDIFVRDKHFVLQQTTFQGIDAMILNVHNGLIWPSKCF